MKIRRAWRMLAWGGCLAASAAAAGPQAVETEPGPGARAVRVVGQPGDSPAALRARLDQRLDELCQGRVYAVAYEQGQSVRQWYAAGGSTMMAAPDAVVPYVDAQAVCDGLRD
ncbi:hypothetical protein [Pigmentiphaga sp.]|uniref:hypothetical protein n=1 Tax=Pigmentiphaga sp. TaxID=1977564 RepID=UPI00128CA91A|nr:hypothetical protein [Pigmentiphaga sp.]MPS30261.1 hypothetical protein [Alcaligenaceae bacterium SAGV5]MPS55048.1 hypothetical protein [Alcaligenaceae bacterium SAGV3]MPT59127.1 hypothetical protein [Alcaligenaceae bacterium]